MRNTKSFALLMAVLLSSSGFADTLYSPFLCEGKSNLKLTNLSAEEQPVGFQFRDELGNFQERWVVLPQRNAKLLGPDLLPSVPYSIRTESASILAVQECGNQSYFWSPKTTPLRTWKLKPGSTHKFFVQNLNPLKQSLMLRFLGPTRKIVGTQVMTLGTYMSTSITKFAGFATEVEVQAEGRISAQMTYFSSGVLKTLPESTTPPAKIPVDPKATYFLMMSVDNKDSFVIKISDATLIAKAREIIKEGQVKLMLGDISYQPRSENRSLLSGDKSPYSWHVENVSGFNDFAHVSCNGFPQGVEDKIFERLASKRICFWTYRLERELTHDEVAYGYLKK